MNMVRRKSLRVLSERELRRWVNSTIPKQIWQNFRLGAVAQNKNPKLTWTNINGHHGGPFPSPCAGPD